MRKGQDRLQLVLRPSKQGITLVELALSESREPRPQMDMPRALYVAKGGSRSGHLLSESQGFLVAACTKELHGAILGEAADQAG